MIVEVLDWKPVFGLHRCQNSPRSLYIYSFGKGCPLWVKHRRIFGNCRCQTFCGHFFIASVVSCISSPSNILAVKSQT